MREVFTQYDPRETRRVTLAAVPGIVGLCYETRVLDVRPLRGRKPKKRTLRRCRRAQPDNQ